MKKKIISLLAAVIILSGIVYGGISKVFIAKTFQKTDRAIAWNILPEITENANQVIDNNSLKSNSTVNQIPDLKSKSYYLADYETGTVMFEQNANERRPIASMVKIMTLLLTLEEVDSGKISINDSIVISENAAGMGGSQAFLDANNEYKVDDLVKSIVIASANDACVAIAEIISGSVDGFVVKMNEKAKALGMENTNFTNCTGLPAPGQYSCAKDVSIMTRELLKHKDYYKYSNIWMYDLTHPSGRITGLTNTNKLIRFYDGCDGGKTGFTNEALFCLSATARRNGMRVIATVIGAPDSKTRFNETTKLFNYAFANYESKTIVLADKTMDERVPVIGGISDSVSVRPEEDFAVFSEKGKIGEIIKKIEHYKIKAPVKTNDVVGKLIITKDGGIIKEIALLCQENVKAKTYMDYVKDIAEKW